MLKMLTLRGVIDINCVDIVHYVALLYCFCFHLKESLVLVKIPGIQFLTFYTILDVLKNFVTSFGKYVWVYLWENFVECVNQELTNGMAWNFTHWCALILNWCLLAFVKNSSKNDTLVLLCLEFSKQPDLGFYFVESHKILFTR